MELSVQREMISFLLSFAGRAGFLQKYSKFRSNSTDPTTSCRNTALVMKTPSRQGHRRFELKLLGYGNCYYIERIARLEAALARKPRMLQIDMVGVGEIPADSALLIRSVLLSRSPKTHLITNARSSLQNGSVLVWLLGDSRLMRDDARLFFRRATLSENDDAKKEDDWNDEPEFCDSFSEMDPEEGDYARVLQCINEFLPVKELVGRLIEMPVLRQFGLVENEKVDHFLATAFGVKREPPNCSCTKSGSKWSRMRTAKSSAR